MNIKTSQINHLKETWYFWLFPVLALIVCGYFLATYLGAKGPEIKIFFEDGSSLQAEKTRVRFRGVNIGLVKSVRLTEDGKQVEAVVGLQKEASSFAVEGSKFWVVAPKVSFQGISGLETLIEGTYIAAQKGPDPKKDKKEFQGKLEGDAADPLDETVAYFLETSHVGSVNVNDVVSFRGLNIGSVTKVTLVKQAQVISVQINIPNRYIHLIRENTVFWRKKAVQAKLGLFKSEIKVESLDSLLKGGIDLFTPTSPGPIAKAQSRFPLLEDPPKDLEKWNPKL